MSRAAKGFPPVIDAKIETLILGSFPGVASLVKAQYYGHPQNHFWRLVGAVIEEPLAEMDYEARKRTLLKHRIGLWDIIDTCAREGSLDSNIRDARHSTANAEVSGTFATDNVIRGAAHLLVDLPPLLTAQRRAIDLGEFLQA